MSESGGEGNAGYVFNTIFSILDTLVGQTGHAYPPFAITPQVVQMAERCEGLYQLTTVTKSTFERGQKLFGINEQRVRHIGNGQLEFDGDVYSPVSDHSFMHENDGGRKELGFTLLGDDRPKYMAQRMYWAFERIPWYKSVLGLQLCTGLGMLILLYFSTIRPLFCRIGIFKKVVRRGKSYRWLQIASGGLLIGFVIVVTAFGLDVEITNGTPLIYKMGLWLITISTGLLLLLTSVLLWRTFSIGGNWNSGKTLNITFCIGVALVLISYWSMNLIGFNYY